MEGPREGLLGVFPAQLGVQSLGHFVSKTGEFVNGRPERAGVLALHGAAGALDGGEQLVSVVVGDALAGFDRPAQVNPDGRFREPPTVSGRHENTVCRLGVSPEPVAS